MPPRARTTRKTTQPEPIDVGGVEVTAEQIRAAINVLTSAKGIMVKQPLAKAASPLAGADYHRVAEQERIDSLDNLLKTKQAFVQALERRLAQ